MNREQLDKIMDVVRDDATIRFRYFAGGGTCVIGGLVLALPDSGKKREAIAMLRADPKWAIGGPGLEVR